MNPDRQLPPAPPLRNPHVTVCICTYKRTELLPRLLQGIEKQKTDDLFTYSVVVGDNDEGQSARSVVEALEAVSKLSMTYCVEPRQSIALIRNKVIENATGDFIAFIDDDEFPIDTWLRNLFLTCMRYQVDGAFGPIKAHFDFTPPRWAHEGKFFERSRYPTGYEMEWTQMATGNVLFKRSILPADTPPFMPEFDSGGEDVDFFRRMTRRGARFVWCDAAIAFEVVPRSRCKRTYLLRRALQRGSNFPKQQGNRVKNFLKSLVAVPVYFVALPVIALFGQLVLLRYLIKLCDHGSRLMAFLGVKLVDQRVQ